MHEGMLWLINSKSLLTPEQKIIQARDYFQKKYGRTPDLCLVHPTTFDQDPKTIQIEQMTVRAYRPVLPGHIWVGFENKPGGDD